MLHDRYANAVKARILIFSELLEFAVRKIHRVGIERGQHSLDRSLGGLLVVDVARIFDRNRGNGFVVILLNVVWLGVGNCSAGWCTTTESSRAADRAADHGCNQN